MIEVKELSFMESKPFLNTFYIEEKPTFSDWYEAEDETAEYIWIIEDFTKPRGFLSYKVFVLPNSEDFLYIVKIYALNGYKGREAILFNEERVSEILFRQIVIKGINILTLESADEKLDAYYKKLGFEYNAEKSRIFSSVIDGKSRDIMIREVKRTISDTEKHLFGEQ